jgi:predicted nucleic acid-binding protein
VSEILVSEPVIAEVHEYAPRLAVKRRLPLDVVLMTVATLPVNVVARAVYEQSIAEARRRIGRRDPDDVETLALALHAGIAVWSNDNDFEDAGVEWFTTAELLARLV